MARRRASPVEDEERSSPSPLNDAALESRSNGPPSPLRDEIDTIMSPSSDPPSPLRDEINTIISSGPSSPLSDETRAIESRPSKAPIHSRDGVDAIESHTGERREAVTDPSRPEDTHTVEGTGSNANQSGTSALTRRASTQGLAVVQRIVNRSYHALEGDVEQHLKVFFEFVQRDISHNARLLFFVGVCAGGGLGRCVCAWGLGFGLSAFRFERLALASALMATLLLVDNGFQETTPSLLGWFQLGCVTFQIMERRLMDPYSASGLTLAAVACVSPSPWLSVWIALVHWYSAFQCMLR